MSGCDSSEDGGGRRRWRQEEISLARGDASGRLQEDQVKGWREIGRVAAWIGRVVRDGEGFEFVGLTGLYPNSNCCEARLKACLNSVRRTPHLQLLRQGNRWGECLMAPWHWKAHLIAHHFKTVGRRHTTYWSTILLCCVLSWKWCRRCAAYARSYNIHYFVLSTCMSIWEEGHGWRW